MQTVLYIVVTFCGCSCQMLSTMGWEGV